MRPTRGTCMSDQRAAVKNAPSDAPPDYIAAVDRLHAVLLPHETQTEMKRIVAQEPRNTTPTGQAMTTPNSSPSLPSQIPNAAPCYNLCSQSQHMANEVFFKESPNVVTAEHDPAHTGRFTLATKLLRIQEAYVFSDWNLCGSGT